MEKEKSKNSILMILFILSILILAFIIIWSTIKLTGGIIYFSDQGNNQQDYNPPNWKDKQPTQQKNWENVIYDLKTQIKVEALKLDIPVSKVRVFTKSSGEPFQLAIQFKNGWYDKIFDDKGHHNSEFVEEHLIPKVYQIVKNLGLKLGDEASIDFENGIRWISIE